MSIRRDLAGLLKLEDLLFQQVKTLIPGSKFFKAKRQWRLNNGATLRKIHIDAGDSFNKIQGKASAMSSETKWGRKPTRRGCLGLSHLYRQ